MSRNTETVPVVVTGFGPFGEHKVNASWETAKALLPLNLEASGIKLITDEIPVIYQTAAAKVFSLWEQHRPKLMVHIGVSALATQITLETLAHKTGYSRPDVEGCLPGSGCCPGSEDCIAPELDIEKVCDEINSEGLEISSCVSSNAGRYLCEFTYYTSLKIDRSRVVFIHVPDINKPYTAEEMAKCVKKIILLLLQEIKTRSECDLKKIENNLI